VCRSMRVAWGLYEHLPLKAVDSPACYEYPHGISPVVRDGGDGPCSHTLWSLRLARSGLKFARAATHQAKLRGSSSATDATSARERALALCLPLRALVLPELAITLLGRQSVDTSAAGKV